MADDHSGKGPWGTSPSGQDNKPGDKDSPWGQKPGRKRPGQKPGARPEPDIDEILRQAQDRLGTLFGGGKGRGGGGGRHSGGAAGAPLPWRGIIALAFILYAITGFYRVLPEENAVILTFGEWTGTKEDPGLGYHLPWPFQTVEKVNVAFERRIEVGFRDEGVSGATGNNDIPNESLMLTGDENIIDIDFVVLWRINNAGEYLFEIRDPENTIKKVAESAMREVIGRTPIQKALTESRAQIQQDTRSLMQQMLDEYQSGIEINDVQLLAVNPPTSVIDAFDDVQRARADKERLKNEAEAYRNDILPRARGEAEKIIQEAEAYRESVINRATGEADRFAAIYAAYADDKAITLERLYIETLEDVLSNAQKIIIDGDNTGNVLPYLPLNELRKTTPAPAKGEK